MANFVLDKEKYKAAFLYLLEKLGKIEGKKKAYKLLYFLDFDFYEAYDRPFTGETYTALPMGPAPRYFDGIAEELQKEGLIEIVKSKTQPYHENDTVIFSPKKIIKSHFSGEEQKMLDRVVKVYGNLTGKDLENLSHEQAPYAAVSLYDVIPYEFSYYRDTPNLK